MGYNWEEIFKNTTSQELYKIYKGQTTKTGEAIHYAKNELDRRGFDFANMEQNRKKWELLNILENKTIDQFDFSGQKTSYISFKKYVLILIGILIFFYLLNWYNNDTIQNFIDLIPFAIGFSSILVIINNIIYRQQKKNSNKRNDKINELKKYVEQKGKTVNDTVFQEDIRLKNIEINDLGKSQITIGIILTIIIVLVAIYSIFLK